MPTGVLIIDLTCNYYVDVVKELISNGLPIKLAAISERNEYQPDNLSEFLKSNSIKFFNYGIYLISQKCLELIKLIQ